MSDNDLSVIIVHPNAEVRQMVRAACDSVRLATIAYQRADEFLSTPAPEAAGCIVMGLRIPGFNAPELLTELARRNRALPAIVVTSHADVCGAVEVMKLGVLDLFEAPVSPLRLIDAIHRALRIERHARQARSRYAQIMEAMENLSDREREVLNQLLAGHSNKAVAQAMRLSEKTIATHRNNILLKMGASSIIELVVRLYPALTMPQIFLNPWAVNPVDVVPALLDSPFSPKAA